MSTQRPSAAPVSRDELAQRTVEVLNRGNARNPDVLLVDGPEGRVVVKDFAPRGAVVRATVGRWVTAREAAAHRWLEGHPAVPRFLGFLDPLAIALEYRPGRRISRHLVDDAGPGFPEVLAEAVAGLHERGLVHLDLGHRSNILIDAQGQPVLIDFASAVWFRPGSLGARLILPRLAHYDLRAVAKWDAKLARQRALRAGRAAEAARGEGRPT